jgi:DNA-binding response OmpR family regulator
MKILVADDELLIRKTLKKVFEQKGFDVLMCADGQEALDQWPAFKPDLVILDVIMPNKGGVEVLKEIKGLKQFESAKIIVISAYSAGGTKEEFLKMGAVDFFRKPFENIFVFVDQCLSYVGSAH